MQTQYSELIVFKTPRRFSATPKFHSRITGLEAPPPKQRHETECEWHLPYEFTNKRGRKLASEIY